MGVCRGPLKEAGKVRGTETVDELVSLIDGIEEALVGALMFEGGANET